MIPNFQLVLNEHPTLQILHFIFSPMITVFPFYSFLAILTALHMQVIVPEDCIRLLVFLLLHAFKLAPKNHLLK